jgi:hypothetical protein
VIVDGRPGPMAQTMVPPRPLIELTTTPDRAGQVVPFCLSPEGEHVAWAGVFEDEARPVIDDRVGPPFEDVVAWSFDDAGVATWWAHRGEDVFVVRASAVGTDDLVS